MQEGSNFPTSFLTSVIIFFFLVIAIELAKKFIEGYPWTPSIEVNPYKLFFTNPVP